MNTKMKKRDKFVICSMVNITWFTVAALVLAAFDKTVPDALIIAFFAAWTAELAILAGIKIKDNKKGDEQ